MSVAGQAVARCVNLSRIYEEDTVPVAALTQVDFEMAQGDFVGLAGPSGSGKSTLLNLIGGLDRASRGEISVDGVALQTLNEAQLADLRLHKIGFVFQSYNLVPVLSAQENVEFILQLQGAPATARRERALAALASLGIGDLAQRRPGELSSGQQQRVAIARAIVTDPVLLLADEPSANLDSATTEELLKLLRRLNDERGLSILTATHDPLVMGYAKRHVHLRDGAIVEDAAAGA